jgi:hypothetical protein
MALQSIEREIALNGGMDVKQSTELAPETSLRAVTNLRWDSLGELRKRPTYASSVTPDPASGASYSGAEPEALFTRGAEVFALTKDLGVVSVDRSDPDTVVWPSVDGLKYAPRACKVSRRFLERAQFGRSGSYIYQVASAVYEDTLVVVWIVAYQGGRSLCIEALDVNTGQVVMQRNSVGLSSVSANLSVAAIPCRTTGAEGVLITYGDDDSAPYTIRYVLYNAATRALSDGILTSNARYVSHAVADAGAGVTWQFYLAFCDNTSGFLTCQLRTVSSVTMTHTGTLADPTAFAIIPGLTNTLLVTSTSGGVYAERWQAPAGRITAFTASSETFAGVTGSLETDATDRAIIYVNCATSGVTPSAFYVRTANVEYLPEPSVGETGLTPQTWTMNRAFCYENRSYVALTTSVFHDSASVILARYRETASSAGIEPVARLGHDRFYSFLGGIYGDVYSTTVVGRKVHMVFMADPSEAGAIGSSRAPQALFHGQVEFPDTAMPLQSVERDGVTHIAAGLLVEWDGVDTSESCPLVRPRVEVRTFDVAGTGTGPDNFAQAGTATTLTLDDVTFPTDVVGRSITITGSTTPANNGTFVVTARLADNQIRWTNASGVAEAFPGNWSLSGAQGQTGTFSLVAIHRRVNSKGLLVRSAPSAAVSTGAITNKEIQAYVSRPLFAAYGRSHAQVMEPELYITESGGSAYYLAASGGQKEYTSGFSDDLWWRFDTVQAGSDSEPPLYTNGGELPAEAPPAFASICRIGDRLWALDAEDRARVWFSKPLVAGFSAEWNVVCTLVVGDDGVAVADSSGTPTVFASNGVWAIYGTGPDASNAGQNFAPALKQPLETSCIDPLVCKTSAGLVFRSRRGFCLLGQGLQPLGLPIDPSTKAPALSDYTYARVVFDEVHNEVRVVDDYLGRQWVYNLLEQKWSEWSQNVAKQNAVDMVTCDGRVWYLHYSGEVVAIRREYGVDEVEEVSRSDEGWSIQTPKVRLESVMGRGRLREIHLALKARAPGGVADTILQVATLTVSLETFGAGDDAVETFSWTGAQLAAIGSEDGKVLVLQIRHRFQRCTAFRVTVTETSDTDDTYSGSSPIALRLLMGVDGKASRHVRSGARKGPT